MAVVIGRYIQMPSIWTEDDYKKYWSYTDEERALYARWERQAIRDEDEHARLANARAEMKQAVTSIKEPLDEE